MGSYGSVDKKTCPDSKVHGANMGPTWGRQDPGGPHVGHVNLAIWVAMSSEDRAQVIWIFIYIYIFNCSASVSPLHHLYQVESVNAMLQFDLGNSKMYFFL